VTDSKQAPIVKDFDITAKVTKPSTTLGHLFAKETKVFAETKAMILADRETVQENLKVFAENFNALWNRQIQSTLQSTMNDSVSSILNSPGKRIRALLAFWFARFFANNDEQKILLMSIGTSVEVLHAASLCIDDIQDGSLERRGLPTLAVQFGMPSALNAASMCYFLALENLPDVITRSLANKVLIQCHLGQGLDLASISSEFISKWIALSAEAKNLHYDQVADLKTGALMKLICLCAGETLHKDPIWKSKIQSVFRQYGILFQILDDLRNLSPKLSGSKTFEDLETPTRNKIFVIFYNSLPESEKTFFNELLISDRKLTLKEQILNHPYFEQAVTRCISIARETDNKIQSEILDVCQSDQQCIEYLKLLFGAQYDVLKEFDHKPTVGK
jgi:geranylgeranyl pyrophosphate synthase